jgi:hypothetical protein
VIVVVGALALGGEFHFFETSRRASVEQLANETVAANVADARALLSSKQWDQAAHLLQATLLTPDATDLTMARTVLVEAERGRAASLLQGARQAITEKDVAQALSLLEEYLADPAATDRDQARLLQSELTRVTSQENASELLRQVSDQALIDFARGGTLPVIHRISDRAMRELFVQTLHSQAAVEQERREGKRRAEQEAAQRKEQERLKQEARIRATPAYQELVVFLDSTRKSQAAVAGNPQLMSYLFKELNLNNPAEQSKALADLTAPASGMTNPEAAVTRERLVLKERFRSYRDFGHADQEQFERMVDGELDRLLQELNGKQPLAGG